MSRAFLVMDSVSLAQAKSLKETGDILLLVENENSSQAQSEVKDFFYLPCDEASSQAERAMGFIASWYKNSEGCDESAVTEAFSMGALLSGFLSIDFPLFAREALAVEKWTNEVREFCYPSHYPFKKYLCLLSEMGLCKTLEYDCGPSALELSKFCIKFSFRHYPERFYINPIKRIFSWFFVPFRHFMILDRNLYFPDWTYLPLLRQDVRALAINGSGFSKNLFFSPVWSGTPLPKSLSCIELNLKKTLNENLKRFSYPEVWTDLIWSSLDRFYSENQTLLQSTAHFYRTLFSYRPRSITLPTDLLEVHNIAVQYAKIYGVRVNLLIDGFPIIASGPYLKFTPKSWFFDGVFAASETFKKQFMDFRNFPTEEVKVVPPYVASLLSKLDMSQTKDIDVLVFTLIPNNLNPDFRLSHLRQYLLNVCGTLKKQGLQKIVIKCKSREESFYAEPVAKDMGVDVSYEPSLEIMPRSKCIVGGISSAAMEASLLGIPYYIYEPVENGYSCHQLRESKFKVIEVTARSASELEANFIQRRYFGSSGFDL